MVFGVIVVVCINYLYYLILSGEKPFSTKRVLEGEIERKGVKGSKGNSTVVDNIENQSCRNGWHNVLAGKDTVIGYMKLRLSLRWQTIERRR